MLTEAETYPKYTNARLFGKRTLPMQVPIDLYPTLKRIAAFRAANKPITRLDFTEVLCWGLFLSDVPITEDSWTYIRTSIADAKEELDRTAETADPEFAGAWIKDMRIRLSRINALAAACARRSDGTLDRRRIVVWERVK